MKHIRTALILLSLLALQNHAHAQDAMREDTTTGPVLVRAVGNAPSAEVVRYVADNARPVQFDLSYRPELAQASPRQIIEQQCGSVNEAYAAAFARANPKASLDLDRPIGEPLTLTLPACLFARGERTQTYTVKAGDTLTGIRKRFTGDGRFDVVALNDFFASSNLSMGQAKTLAIGREVAITESTVPTLLVPRASADNFLVGLERVARGGVATESNAGSPGNIIGPVRGARHDAGAVQAASAECEAGDESRPYPFDGAEIEDVYLASQRALASSVAPVSVVIVDNGFFGVPCDSAHCPQLDADGAVRFSPRFPGIFFDRSTFPLQGGFGPALIGLHNDPINYRNRKSSGVRFTSVDVNDETGHGTHVAGLSIGGPNFVAHRNVYFNDTKSWLRLVIANVAAASTELSPGTDRTIDDLLAQVEGFKVVNMSLAFDGQADPRVAATLAETMGDDPKALFVVAAGNEGGNLEDEQHEFFPARFGGGRFANVLTVASIDGASGGKQKLSAFSNRSSKYVDLAAPGCALSSWVDADRPPVRSTGTSQAAPVVTFAASLLQSLWGVSPLKLKNRLLYSGDLLEVEADQRVIRSKTQLNITKALGVPWTRVEVLRSGERRILLGQLGQLQGLRCEDASADLRSDNVRALKRTQAGKIALFRTDSSGELNVCWGQVREDLELDFVAEREVIDGHVVPAGTVEGPIRVAEVHEVVRAR